MRLATTAVVLLGGCNLVFDVDATSPADASSPADLAGCVPLLSNFDDFEARTAMPCAWGYLTQDSCVATLDNGALTMTPAAGVTNTICVCGTNTPLLFTPAFGTMVEVEQIGPQMGEYSQFAAHDAGGAGAWDIRYQPASMTLSFHSGSTNLGAIPWDPALRWWRIRPDDGGTAVLGEASRDGRSWTRLGMDPTTPPAMIEMSFQEGTFTGLVAPTTARVASINVCP